MPAAKNGHTILLGEDDLEVRNYLETALKCQGYSIEVAQDGQEVLACLNAHRECISAVVLDIIMPLKNGMDALKEIRRFSRDLPVIMISGASSPLNVVEAIKNGANDFMVKPIKPEDLRKALKAVLQPVEAAASAAEQSAGPARRQVLFGTSPEIRELQNLLGQIGWSEAPILIQGETGTGKEVLARELHASSPRAKKAFLKLNCAALPSELVESELFGHERGAFTGAVEKKAGMFAAADGGTILLDEIGDMDFKLQAKLLQVLQDKEFQRLGAKDTVKVDVRVIAATHRDLEEAIVEGSFREDLYYRLNVINMRVPALRDRKEDIIPLADFLLKKHTAAGAIPLKFPPALKELFLQYPWPGNVRELENIARKFLILQDEKAVERELRQKMEKRHRNRSEAERGPLDGWTAARSTSTIPPPPSDDPGKSTVGTPSGPVLEQVANAKREAERIAITGALKCTNWNRKQASMLLQIDYKALLYKMKTLSIKKEKAAPQPIPTRVEPLSSSAPSRVDQQELPPALARHA